MFSFQKLNVYKDASDLVLNVYSLIKKFPKTEQFSLCDQLRRATISVPSNIAEGMSRISKKEQIHFLEIAFGSLMEVLCQMELSYKLGFINQDEYTQIQSLIERVSKEISGLRRSIIEKTN